MEINYLLKTAEMIRTALDATNAKELQLIKEDDTEVMAYCVADSLNNTLNNNIPLANSAMNLGRCILLNYETAEEPEKDRNIRRWKVGWFMLNIFLKEDILRLTKDWRDVRAEWMVMTDYEIYRDPTTGKTKKIFTHPFIEGLLRDYKEDDAEVLYYKNPITLKERFPYETFHSPVHGALVHNANHDVQPYFTESQCPLVFKTINKHSDIKYQLNTDSLDVFKQCLGDDMMTFNDKILNSDQREGLERERDAVLEQAENAKEYKFYRQSMFFDNRGRLYPNTIYLNTTGGKMAKSLIRLHEETAIGTSGYFWMLMHAANAFGYDKETIDNRVTFAEENLPAWMEMAANPLKNKLWQKADDPFGFYTIIQELYKAHQCDNKFEYKSGVLVAFDASCSGLQVLSALSRDKKSGALCNLIPSDTRGDYYLTIANEVWDEIEYTPEEFELYKEVVQALRDLKGDKAGTQEYIDTHIKTMFAISKVYWAQPEIRAVRRKVCKRGGMTYLYSCSGKTMGKQIYVDFSTDALFVDMNKIFAKWLGTKIYYACRRVMPGPTALMKLFIEMGVEDYQDGKDFSLIAPYNKFKLMHHYRDNVTKNLRVKYNGKLINVSIAIGKNDKLNYRKIQSATSPNVVHMLDSQIVSYLVNNCDYPVVCVHDSFSTSPAYAGYLYDDTRSAMKFLFDNNVLLELLKQKGMEDRYNDLIIGDLDISLLDDNEWCFS